MLAGRILTVLRASVWGGSNGGVDDEGGLVLRDGETRGGRVGRGGR